MHSDEEEIRRLVSTWMAATKAGDVDTVLSLMADDAVFLVTGQPVMRKDDFEAGPKEQIVERSFRRAMRIFASAAAWMSRTSSAKRTAPKLWPRRPKERRNSVADGTKWDKMGHS